MTALLSHSSLCLAGAMPHEGSLGLHHLATNFGMAAAMALVACSPHGPACAGRGSARYGGSLIGGACLMVHCGALATMGFGMSLPAALSLVSLVLLRKTAVPQPLSWKRQI